LGGFARLVPEPGLPPPFAQCNGCAEKSVVMVMVVMVKQVVQVERVKRVKQVKLMIHLQLPQRLRTQAARLVSE